MRAKALKILFAFLVCLHVCSASAKPHKAASTPPGRHRIAARSARHTAHAHATRAGHRAAAKPAAKRVVRSRHEPSSAPVPRAEAQEQVHVRHNRKAHATSSPQLPPTASRGNLLRDRVGSESLAEAADQAVASTTPSVPLNSDVLVHRGGRLVMPAALKGSREILMRQNEMADRDGLDRVQDDRDLERMRASKTLVAIPSSAGVVADERLPANRRYCRPWTAQFLAELGRAHYARFGRALQVNSAVRTVEFQQRLLLRNGNAAPAEGETASPHLTGQAVDLAKRGLSLTEIAWLRGYLLPLIQEGKIDVEEEFQQSCFHISVYRRYLPQPDTPRTIAGQRSGTTTALAAAVR